MKIIKKRTNLNVKEAGAKVEALRSSALKVELVSSVETRYRNINKKVSKLELNSISSSFRPGSDSCPASEFKLIVKQKNELALRYHQTKFNIICGVLINNTQTVFFHILKRS